MKIFNLLPVLEPCHFRLLYLLTGSAIIAAFNSGQKFCCVITIMVVTIYL